MRRLLRALHELLLHQRMQTELLRQLVDLQQPKKNIHLVVNREAQS